MPPLTPSTVERLKALIRTDPAVALLAGGILGPPRGDVPYEDPGVAAPEREA